MRLTKRAIEATAHHGKPGTAHYLWDDEVAGFGLRIYPSGRKSFVISYRTKGRQRFHTLGRFGEFTAQEARTEALEKLARIRRGADPSGNRLAYREAPTVNRPPLPPSGAMAASLPEALARERATTAGDDGESRPYRRCPPPHLWWGRIAWGGGSA